MEEKRKHQRYPVIHEMGEPVQLSVSDKTIPGVLVDLSAGGIALLAYSSVPVGTELSLAAKLPGLETKELRGSVVWVVQKGEMWRMGIAFSSIDPLDFRHINRMAFDFNDCETRLGLGAKDVCWKKCSYFLLCHKPVKLKQ